MSVLRSILTYSMGDFVAKTLSFFAYVHMARALGVANYGALEFATSILTYFLVLAEGGLEVWATREAAQGRSIGELAGRIVPLRLAAAVVAFIALLAASPFLPNYPSLQRMLFVLGLTLFVQAVNLKWVLVGQHQMSRAATGLLISQGVFAIVAIFWIKSPSQLEWVPVVRLLSEVILAVYFWVQYVQTQGPIRLSLNWRSVTELLRPSLAIGISNGLGLANYNLSFILLGFMLGPAAVGLYAVASRPNTAALALPLSYLAGLYPVLARTSILSRDTFRRTISYSIRISATLALPFAVGATFLAEPLVKFMFGPAYGDAVLATQLLAWAAAVVILRGTFFQALNAAGYARLNLVAAIIATIANLVLGLLLIPLWGASGAALASLVANCLWLVPLAYFMYSYVVPINLLPYLVQPVIAAIAMGIGFSLTTSLSWPVQFGFALVTYFSVLLLLTQTEVRSWLQGRQLRVPNATE